MRSLFDAMLAYASPWLTPLGALLAISFVGSAVAGLALGLALVVAWSAFTRVFRIATGRPFVFTRKMACALSSLWGVAISVGCAYRLFQAVTEGAITTHPRHGTPQVYYWSLDRSGFVWAVFELILAGSGAWAVVAAALFKGADYAGKGAASTPPPRTAPR